VLVYFQPRERLTMRRVGLADLVRTSTLVLMIAAVVGAGGCVRDTKSNAIQAAVAKPMPPLNAVNLAVMTAYGFMSFDFARGDALHFAESYEDDASFAATGLGGVRGRYAIARAVSTQGRPRSVSDLRRETHGQSIDGRLVRDSGRYELVGQKGHRATDMDPRGQYWTVWRYTEQGNWEIIADTLIGDKRTRGDLVADTVHAGK
jgi:hypothetical protein